MVPENTMQSAKKKEQLKTTQSYPDAMSMNHNNGQYGKIHIRGQEKALKCWWQIAANWT